MVDRTAETVVVDGHRIHYVAAGDPADPPIVLLHGGIIDAADVSWGAVIEPLAREYRVVAPDLLGYGRSAKPDVSYAIDTHVDVVASFVDELDLAPTSVVGLSMGGGVGLGLTLREPETVDHLVLIDSYGLGQELANGFLTLFLARVQVFNRIAIALMRRSRSFTRAGLGNIVHDLDSLSPEAVDAVWREVQRPGAGKAFRGFRDAEVTSDGYRTVFTDRFENVDAPTMLLHGEHDDVFPPAWSERAAERIPDAEFRLLEDCAHWAPRERTDAVVDLITSFVPTA